VSPTIEGLRSRDQDLGRHHHHLLLPLLRLGRHDHQDVLVEVEREVVVIKVVVIPVKIPKIIGG
jgi:hypothetical protein